MLSFVSHHNHIAQHLHSFANLLLNSSWWSQVQNSCAKLLLCRRWSQVQNSYANLLLNLSTKWTCSSSLMASSIETGATFSPEFEKDKRFLGDFSHEPEQRYYIVFNMSQRSTRCDWIENWKPTSRCNNQLLDSPANVEESILIHSTKIPCKTKQMQSKME